MGQHAFPCRKLKKSVDCGGDEFAGLAQPHSQIRV